tara:strand:+ start:2075 stop:2398 length:324 start_codon:yes stop_codon:yes gene_type:complete
MLTIGIFSALGLLLLALKAGGRKTIGSDLFVDVLITVTLLVAFYGTFSGMAAAMIGGLSASIVLFVLRKTMVHEVLEVVNQPKTIYKNFKIATPKVQWKEVKPTWRK